MGRALTTSFGLRRLGRRERDGITNASTLPRWAVRASLALALTSSFVWLLYQARGMNFWGDEWAFLHRRGNDLDTLLTPHGEHLSLVPLLVYKALLAVAGLDSYWVFQLVLTLLHLAIGALLFVLVQRRTDSAPALALTIVLLFLGPAWEDILWAFQVGYLTSVASGLGALLLLERPRAVSDVGAALLLVVSIASSSLGLPFLAAAAVAIALTRRSTARAAVVVVPAVVYAAWYLAYGGSSVVWGNVFETPGYAAALVAEGVGALTSLGGEWGRPLALVLIFFVVWQALGGGFSPVGSAALAGGVAFWAVTGLARATHPEAPPTSSRYIYPTAVFLLLVLAELLRGWRPSDRAVAVLGVATALIVVTNAGQIYEWKSVRLNNAYLIGAELGAIEITRAVVDPGFAPDPDFERRLGPELTAGAYLSLVDAHGSPAFDSEEISLQAEPYRQAADVVLGQALRLGLVPAVAPDAQSADSIAGSAPVVLAANECVRVPLAAGTLSPAIEPETGGVLFATGPAAAEVRAGRVADHAAFVVGTVSENSAAVVRFPPDAARMPWYVEIVSPVPVLACASSGAHDRRTGQIRPPRSK